jgi:hypothetical protein
VLGSGLLPDTLGMPQHGAGARPVA